MSSNSVHINSSSSSSTSAPAEQLCYIPCRFCNIILAVSVPCSSLLDIVTVRCGHCANLWSVNMAASLHPLSASWQHQLRSLPQPQLQQQLKQPHPPPQQPLQQHHHLRQDFCLVQAPSGMTAATNYRLDVTAPSAPPAVARCNKSGGVAAAGMMRAPAMGMNEERTSIVNRRKMDHPPEKKQRVPSAYNQFIKEEIRRIKANNPDISHREAFSTAAKNWARFPHIQFGLMLENDNQARLRDRGV